MKSLIEVLRLSAQFLQDKGVERPRREAEELFCHTLNVDRLQLYLDHERPIEETELALLRELLSRRAKKEPLQYILGTVDFLNCTLQVDARVLIPRPETELLAEFITKALKDKNGVLLDLCCGSGCLAIAIKKACPAIHVIASDCSIQALELARLNALVNKVEIEFLHGDLFVPLQERKIDYFVSNPPYITTNEIDQLQAEVRNYEPRLALHGGDDGLDFYRRINQELPSFLRSSGLAWLEIGASQGSSVKGLFDQPLWKECRLEQDLAGLDRYIFLVKE